MTPLMIAAMRGNAAMTSLLLRKGGARARGPGLDGQRVLRGVHLGAKECARVLLRVGDGAARETTAQGATAQHFAVAKKRFDVAKWLLGKDIKISHTALKSSHIETPVLTGDGSRHQDAVHGRLVDIARAYRLSVG